MYLEQPWRLDPIEIATLLAISARLDLAPGPGGSRITPLGPAVEEAREVLSDLAPRWTAAAVVALYPSAQLVAHRDPPIEARRYHVPLVVNPGCWVFHEGMWQQLNVGRVYAMDPTETHGAVNWGADIRLHLMVDVEE